MTVSYEWWQVALGWLGGLVTGVYIGRVRGPFRGPDPTLPRATERVDIRDNENVLVTGNVITHIRNSRFRIVDDERGRWHVSDDGRSIIGPFPR